MASVTISGGILSSQIISSNSLYLSFSFAHTSYNHQFYKYFQMGQIILQYDQRHQEIELSYYEDKLMAICVHREKIRKKVFCQFATH